MRISEILNLPIMTGHTPRHTLVSHLLKNDQITEDNIRIILSHSNIADIKEDLADFNQFIYVENTNFTRLKKMIIY